MSDWKVINAPTFLTAPASDLLAAINNAPAGAVITVEDAGDPLNLTLTRNVPGYGVTVDLPADQVLRATVNGGAGGYNFYGGRWSADHWRDNPSVNTNGLNMLSGSSRVSLHGAAFYGNHNAVAAIGATDIWLRNIRADITRQDMVHFNNCQRMRIEGSVAGPGARGEKICYFDDGRAPAENINRGNCETAGGQWEDTPHNDVVQAHAGCTDLSATDNYFATFAAQGIASFGSEDDLIFRVEVARNTILDAAAHGIFLEGGDIDVRDNAMTTAPGFASATLTVKRFEDGLIRGGRNTAPSFVNPAGVDLAAGTINGDEGLTPPTPPQIILPPWAPEIPPVPPAPAVEAPQHINGGGIRWVGWHSEAPPPAAGTWLSLNRGQFSDVAGTTWEYRWRTNGVLNGTTTQMFQAVSGTIVAEARGINGEGAGEWHSYDAVVVV